MTIENTNQAPVVESGSNGEAAQSVTENSQAPAQNQQTFDSKEFVSRKDFNKVRETERKLKSELQRIQSEYGQLQGAKALHDKLSSDPKSLRVMLDLLEGKMPQQGQQEKDPYEAFTPDVAERFRKVDRLEKWQAEQERKEQERSQMSQQEKVRAKANNEVELDQEFDTWIARDGFDKYDPQFQEVMAEAVLARLFKTARDPNFPTKLELKTAYDSVTKGLSAGERTTLKKTIKPVVPLSGSNRGETPSAKQGPKSDDERIRDIVSMLG